MPLTEEEKKDMREVVDLMTELRDEMIKKGWTQSEASEILSAMLAKMQ